MKTINRPLSFLIIALCYIAAAGLAVVVYKQLSLAPWLALLIADLSATLFIWVMSLIFRNASVYDPYWSVQPVVILGLVLIGQQFALESFLLYLVIAFWGFRLTGNWVITFPGLHAQDWRYDQLKDQSGRFFPLVNLFGIQLMPTLIVYACLLPAFYYLMNGGGFTTLTMVGLLVSFGGAALELASDAQMLLFRRQSSDRSRLIRFGLWKHSRHPNYLGEIMMWWGVYLVLLSVYPGLWFLGIGALVNTLLFLFISIPLAEKHLSTYKTGFTEYKQCTRMLLPFPKQPRIEKQSRNPSPQE